MNLIHVVGSNPVYTCVNPARQQYTTTDHQLIIGYEQMIIGCEKSSLTSLVQMICWVGAVVGFNNGSSANEKITFTHAKPLKELAGANAKRCGFILIYVRLSYSLFLQ